MPPLLVAMLDEVSSDRRRELLDEHARIVATLPRAAELDDAELDDAIERLGRVRWEYRHSLPRRLLGPCLFTGSPILYPIDDHGLDGPWWSYEAPARPVWAHPPTVYALTGALKTEGLVTGLPHDVMAGPEVPYVIPRLLVLEGTRALLTSLPVGPHTAYVTVYLAPPGAGRLPVADEWGTARWLTPGDGGHLGWESPGRGAELADDAPHFREERDYDLAAWIAAGRLAWIPPGEPGAHPRTETADCPYLDLDGRRHEVWMHADVGR